MQVILLERVDKLGQMGDVVTVKTGYARNYLLPQKKALRATEENRQLFESQRKDIEARNLEAKKDAEKVAETLKGKSITLLRQAGEAGQLYGSVNSRDIAMALNDDGVSVIRGQVVLTHPIKEIGLHDVAIRLHAEVAVDVQVNVARSDEEALAQLEKGGAISAEEMFETAELAHAAEEAIAEEIAAESEEKAEAVKEPTDSDAADAAKDAAEADEEEESAETDKSEKVSTDTDSGQKS